MARPPDALTPLGRVSVIVALAAEAKPIVKHFRLRAAPALSPFRRYVNESGSLRLSVSGVGRVAAGAAVTDLGVDRRDEGWLNIGIAGTAHRSVGEAFMAHRVQDEATRRGWFPSLVFPPPCATMAVRTVDNPCRKFPTPDLYDMEAAGFYAIARRFSSHELVHCLKVVSDNESQGPETATADRVSAWIEAHMATIETLVTAISTLAAELAHRRAEPVPLASLIEATHFTTTERRQLRRILRRWEAVRAGVDPCRCLPEPADLTAGSIIRALSRQLDEIPPDFGAGT